MKRLKQVLILISIFSISGVGITYAASATGNQIQNFFLGNAPLASGNLNQVLALLVGPKGPPGPAGVAGRDGFVGMNGTNGLDGAPGPAGQNGTSVVVVALQAGDKNCPVGGSKLTDGNGTITYVCNGIPGQPGANGANGANGTNGRDGVNGSGGGSYDTTTIGQGILNIGTCDDAVNIALNHTFTGTQFLMSSVVVSNIKGACGNGTNNLTVFLPIKTSGAKIGPSGSNYDLATPQQIIKCTVGPLTAALLPSVESNTVTVSDVAVGGFTASCVNQAAGAPHGANSAILLSDISAQDIDNKLGFTIGN
jgi:Collagen triple helix repeat (20 copies)